MPQTNSGVVVITSMRNGNVMKGHQTASRRAWNVWIITVMLGIGACVRSHDSMVILTDRIDGEADSLRWSQKGTASISHRMEFQTPWVLIFVPRRGFDAEGAARAGVREELRQEVTRRSQAWSGSAVVVDATPQGTGITRLSNKVDVRDQVVLKGEAGKIEVVPDLSRDGDAVAVSSVTTRPIQ